jgi:hypothetical protein
MAHHGRYRLRAPVVCLLLAVVAATAGCVRSNTAVAPGGDPMVVTEDQIALLRSTDAYDIVAQTHGDFIHSRGRESTNPYVPPIPVHIYVDDTFYSADINSLRDINSDVVSEIRFYQSYEAEYKFGSGNIGGVIQVITKN